MNQMSLDNLIVGKRKTPFRITLYGLEGVGKTTFAAGAPNPIFIGAEDGSDGLDVTRFPAPQSLQDVLNAITVLFQDEHDFETVIIDSADWLEQIISKSLCHQHNWESIEDAGYGKGYKMVGEKFKEVLDGLSFLRNERGMNIVIIAHSVVKAFNDPTGESYDHYTLATSEKQITPLLKQWPDALLFADFDKSKKEVGEGLNKRTVAKSYGRRELHTQHNAAHDAKNRYNLPKKLPLEFSAFLENYEAFFADTKKG